MLLCFLGIVAHVGVDVAINAQAPRILTEHTGDTFTAIASSATMVYFVARMIGCFTGGIVLQKISNKLGVRICGVIMTLSAICFAIFTLVPTNPPVWLFCLQLCSLKPTESSATTKVRSRVTLSSNQE